MQDTTSINFDNETTDALIDMRQRIDEALAARRQTLSEQLAKLDDMAVRKPARAAKHKKADHAD